MGNDTWSRVQRKHAWRPADADDFTRDLLFISLTFAGRWVGTLTESGLLPR